MDRVVQEGRACHLCPVSLRRPEDQGDPWGLVDLGVLVGPAGTSGTAPSVVERAAEFHLCLEDLGCPGDQGHQDDHRGRGDREGRAGRLGIGSSCPEMGLDFG